jgi:phosphonate transport system ATP-binding protein
VSLQIDKGAFVGIIGGSGAGKSTLLRMINRLVEPSAGRIVSDGLDIPNCGAGSCACGAPVRRWSFNSLI